MLQQMIMLIAIPTAATGAPTATGFQAATAPSAAAGRCRWVRTRGVVCETELSTVNL